jgi:uncharacterized membrane protein YkvA (DUF1232 family)
MRGWQIAVVVAVVTVVALVLGIRALLRGRRVPPKAKLAIAGAIIWLLSPIDVIPDMAMPVGLLDDLAVLIAAVRYVLDQLQPPESGDPGADRRSLDRRLDRHDAIEPTDWRVGDGREGPGPP